MDVQAFKFISAGLMSFALGLTALGIGKIIAAALEGIARNPEAESKITKNMFVGAGLAEAMGLFGLIIALLLMFA